MEDPVDVVSAAKAAPSDAVPAAVSDAASSTAAPPAKDPLQLNRTWICSECGFRNRAQNAVCGGDGHLGCKAPRDSNAANSSAESPAVNERQPWICPSCKASNDAVATTCSVCSAERQYTGVIKSIGDDYSFIACSETAAIFHRDIYICKQVLRAAFRKATPSSGARVCFSVFLNGDGHPNARAVKLLEKQDESAADKRFYGTVKFISEAKGFGFIESPEAFELYKSDVHVTVEDLQGCVSDDGKGCVLGQLVSFSIRLGQIGGRPQAQKLAQAGPRPTNMPTSYKDIASRVLSSCWQQRVLLFGEGDLSFAVALEKRQKQSGGCCLDATVFLDEEQWLERFPDFPDRISDLKEGGHQVRFGVDATTESCAGCAAVFFNFPHLSVTEAQGQSNGVSPSGNLAWKFLQNARATADKDTLVVLGLWSRCDGRPDATLYGRDAHSLVAAAVDASWEDGHSNVLTDALEDGFERERVHADYSFYESYVQDGGYSFRTNVVNAFESSHKEWHLQACFILRVVPRTAPAAWLDIRSGAT